MQQRFTLFILFLFVCLASTSLQPAFASTFDASSDIFDPSFFSEPVAKPPVITLHASFDEELIEDLAEEEEGFKVSKKVSKFKKKIKRASSAFSGFRQPVRDVESIYVLTRSTINYTKPHFLSHLHHFLFRLTPF
ncbi:hypothetical protein [Aridibaculum aurantiacum]|uniref:hypothetical protein n=1 Tax=Aridibaculum aurantiacum TaxID=2810307 RepID=UPI001A96EB39|nr:hypothetical protein [Aridibaculum aurantiacum]